MVSFLKVRYQPHNYIPLQNSTNHSMSGFIPITNTTIHTILSKYHNPILEY